MPNQRQRSLALLDRDVLARSTAPARARIRTYLAICHAWDLEPWPLSTRNVRAFAASLKHGGYRSSAVYFQALCSHQQRSLQTVVPPLIRHCIRDCIRFIQRGLGVSRLKDSFSFLQVGSIPFLEDASPFSFNSLPYVRDMCVIGRWSMLRESELASGRLSHLTLDASTVRP